MSRAVDVDADRDWRRPELEELSLILSCALDAFYENGYHGTSVRDIARRAGLTVPALYYHHENKQAILYALLDHSITAVIDLCDVAVEQAGGRARDQFDNMIECLVLYMTRHGTNAAMDAEIRSLTPDNRRLYASKRRIVERQLTSIIERGVKSGDFSVASPSDTARALLGMIQAVTMWYRPGGRLSPQTVAERYLDICRHTVGARQNN